MSTDSGELLELVHAVMHQVRARQQQSLRDGSPLTPMEARVLRFFARHPGATQSDLAQHSGRDKAQLARLITGLRERGLLACEPDPADRRNLRLSLTDEGEALARLLRQSLRKLGAEAAAGLSPAEREQLHDLLQRVHDNLKT